MSNTLDQVGPTVHVADIVNHGEKLILPDGMTLDNAIDLLERKKVYMQETVSLNESYDVFPWDGANAIAEVLAKKYGWVPAVATPGFFRDNPPEMINIEVGYGKSRQVPWGRFQLPGITGYVSTSTSMKNGRVVFALSAQCLRVNKKAVKELFSDMREYLKEHSIYRGQAIKIRFRNDAGDKLQMPEPKFLNTDDVDESMLIYSKDLQDSIQTNLFTPITRVEDCIANGLSIKRGILLGGTFGTGKSLAAKVASKLAVWSGITYIYVPRADELADAIEFAKQYQSPAAVVFCEDIDRVMGGERDVEMDDILNIIDGIDTKAANIITVLTTNDLEAMNPAMLRPGRLDAVIEVTTPDAEAVERLLRAYGGESIAADTDLTEAGLALNGAIPAVIHEVVKRAKLSQLRLQEPGEKVKQLTQQALLEASKTMAAQLKLLKDRSEARDEKVTIDRLIADHVNGALSDISKGVGRLIEMHE